MGYSNLTFPYTPQILTLNLWTLLLQIRVYILTVLLPRLGCLKDEQNPYYTYILTNNF